MKARVGGAVCLVVASLLVVGSCVGWALSGAGGAVGIFEGHGDVGNVEATLKGGVVYDAAKETYTVSGSGENMWLGADAFQFVWKQASGDVDISADISFFGEGKNPHRKAVVMVRQSLDADSAYADVALHGVGLTSLQFREEKGATTHEVQANVNAPKRIRLVKQGSYYTMWVAGADGKFTVAGASPLLAIREPFYVGIGVCSHEKEVMEKAVFSKVSVKERPSQGPGPAVKLYSFLEVIGAESGDRRAIYVAEGRLEAPNWMKDGKSLLFNREGKIEKISILGPISIFRHMTNFEMTEGTINTGFAVRCNNDHGISPDGTQLVVSDGSQGDGESRVYVLPIGGGTPRLVTKNGPSYWHGWSPDGKTLAFVGQRNGEFDVYTIPVDTNISSGAKAQGSGGANVGAKAPTPGAVTGDSAQEKRLTTAKGLDDGPEYTPDGKYIYFNSVRTGHMQIWRMKADGSEQEQVTNGPGNDWFPHFSPDGKWMVFLTYDASVEGHPENKDVTLRMMSMEDGKIRDVARLYGGQGTINVPSWSPDGKSFAFVSYAWVGEESDQDQ